MDESSLDLGCPLLVGPSRKAFIGRITRAARLPGTGRAHSGRCWPLCKAAPGSCAPITSPPPASFLQCGRQFTQIIFSFTPIKFRVIMLKKGRRLKPRRQATIDPIMGHIFANLRWQDLVDILLVAIIIYQVVLALKDPGHPGIGRAASSIPGLSGGPPDGVLYHGMALGHHRQELCPHRHHLVPSRYPPDAEPGGEKSPGSGGRAVASDHRRVSAPSWKPWPGAASGPWWSWNATTAYPSTWRGPSTWTPWLPRNCSSPCSGPILPPMTVRWSSRSVRQGGVQPVATAAAAL